MARPERNNVDYFPFLCKEGKAMFYIEQKYGNDGYATWIKLLRQLAVNNYHYINLNDKVELMFLASKCRISEDTLKSIILDLCNLGEFHAELWSENMIVWSDKFVEHIKDAYEKRRNKCIDFNGLLQHLHSLGVRKLSKIPPKGVINPQTKEDYTKEEKSIINENDFFIMSDENIKGNPTDYCLKNFRVYIESMIMNFGNGNVDMNRFENNFRLNFPNGSVFTDDKHLRNAVRNSIKKLALEKTPAVYISQIPKEENKW